MPSEIIGRRTHETVGQQLEAERLRKAETPAGGDDLVEKGEPATVPAPHAFTVGNYTAEGVVRNFGRIGALMTVQAHNAPLTGAVIASEDEIDAIAAELANQSLPGPATLSTMLAGLRAPRDPDLAKFKEQVIAAFRHLGLDTKKHFGV
jgi:hypothetical protein